MPLEQRIGWMLLGCVIGFVLGYIVRSLQDIERKVDTVGREVHQKSEDGLVRHPVILDVVLAIVVGVTIWAAFATGMTNGDLKAAQTELKSAQVELKTTQNELKRISYCNQQYLLTQADFLEVFFRNPPASNREERKELKQYFNALQIFTASVDSKNKISDELSTCISKKGK